MNFICDAVSATPQAQWTSLRTAVDKSMSDSLTLIQTVENYTNMSNISVWDKGSLAGWNIDIANLMVIIKGEFQKPNLSNANRTLITNACSNVSVFIARSKAVFEMYLGTDAVNPAAKGFVGVTIPAPIYLPVPQPVYAGNLYLGTGASYSNHRVQNGISYQFKAGKGWVKIPGGRR